MTELPKEVKFGAQAYHQRDIGMSRLPALHRQGYIGDPAFHACRESCRQLVYHGHLCLFVGGKMQADGFADYEAAA